MVTCEEFSCEHAFSKAQIHMTKLLFEGEGAMTREDLYKSHVNRYKNAIFLIGTNDLPCQEVVAGHQNNAALIQPLFSRADITYFTYQFLGKTKDFFPYTQA